MNFFSEKLKKNISISLGFLLWGFLIIIPFLLIIYFLTFDLECFSWKCIIEWMFRS